MGPSPGGLWVSDRWINWICEVITATLTEGMSIRHSGTPTRAPRVGSLLPHMVLLLAGVMSWRSQLRMSSLR